MIEELEDEALSALKKEANLDLSESVKLKAIRKKLSKKHVNLYINILHFYLSILDTYTNRTMYVIQNIIDTEETDAILRIENNLKEINNAINFVAQSEKR